MERTEFSKDATRLLREFQYLSSSAEWKLKGEVKKVKQQ